VLGIGLVVMEAPHAEVNVSHRDVLSSEKKVPVAKKISNMQFNK
jgi:hypothetical protein